MARGWESKSVEEQQSEFNKPSGKGVQPGSPEVRQRTSALESLQMKRAHVAEQLRQAQNSRFIELMRNELAYLDREIAKMKVPGE